MKLAPTPPAETPSHEAYPATLAAYDALTSEQALADFGRWVETELKVHTTREHRDFLDTREYQWEHHGRLTFQEHELEVRELKRRLVDYALTEDPGFVSGDSFKQGLDMTKPVIDIDARSLSLSFPTTAFVSADDLVSWDAGRGSGILKNDRPSHEVIQDYATRDTEIPAVDQATAAILPNGSVVLMSHNAHRVAAAKLKGQPRIRVKNLAVYRATEAINLLATPPPATGR